MFPVKLRQIPLVEQMRFKGAGSMQKNTLGTKTVRRHKVQILSDINGGNSVPFANRQSLNMLGHRLLSLQFAACKVFTIPVGVDQKRSVIVPELFQQSNPCCRATCLICLMHLNKPVSTNVAEQTKYDINDRNIHKTESKTPARSPTLTLAQAASCVPSSQPPCGRGASDLAAV